MAQPHFLQANELYPADPTVAYYASRARNGAAILLMHDLTDLTQRKGPRDAGHFNMYDLNDKGCQNGFTQFAEYIHYYGSYVCPELNLDSRLPYCLNDPDVPPPKDLTGPPRMMPFPPPDMIASGHLFICNEHLGDILRDGNGEDLNPCIECHICRGSSPTGDWMSHCSINPEIGMEHRAHKMIKHVNRLKKVAIIGGGPGGMKCAMWLKERGHTPVIFEKTDALGGQIKSSRYPDFKWELCRYLDFLINQMKRKDIEVRLNTEATPEMIEAEGFDVVIAATGARPRIPDIEGADKAGWNGVTIYGNEDKIGQNVVVVGGASTAAEAAIHLAILGKNVTEISRQGQIAYDLNPIRVIPYMNGKARQEGVNLILRAKTTKIRPNSVTYMDKNGETKTIECDDVVVNGGMDPNDEVAMSFIGSAPEYYSIGDCRQPGSMRHAIRDAYAVAMQI